MKYKVEHPTMKIEKDGNVVNGSGVPVTAITIISNPGTLQDFQKNIHYETICNVFSEIDWEYILGTGHWTPRLNDVVHITPKLVEYYVLELLSSWFESPRKNIKFTNKLYSGIYSYYYTFTLNVKGGKFSLKIEFK